MRSSPLSLAAESVFQYDLQHELNVDLNRLRKKACDDGDIVFILSDQISIWAHSPLFYVTAHNQLPTAFGTEAGTTINDRGVIVRMLFVFEEKRLEFEEVMNSCYTIESLSLLWKAIGGDEVRFRLDTERQHMEMDTSQVISTLPALMLPDFEIHLRETGRELIDEPSSFSLKVHRFLLDARITYYQLKTHAGLNLKDVAPKTSNLSRMVFTEFSLWSIAMYVYCGIPSIIFSLDPNLQDYIAEPTIRDSRLKKNSHCSEFRAEKRLPAEGIEYGLLEIAKAANFLLAHELENWAHFQLYRLAHQFQCVGGGCAEIIPYIIEAIHCNDITDEWMFNTGISWLARYENIHHLWKWPLLYKTKVIPLIIEKIIEIDWENCLDDEKKYERGEDAIELFVRLWKFKQYTSMTKDLDRWNDELIEPLMEHATKVVMEDFDNSVTFSRLEHLLNGVSFSKLAGEDLLVRVINKACMEGNLMKDWSVVEKLLELCSSEQAAELVEERPAETSAVGVEETLLLTKEVPPSQGDGLPTHVEDLGGNRQLDDKENSVGGLKLCLSQGSSGAHKKSDENKKMKSADSRLKGSAAPFIPKGSIIPLGELNGINDIPYGQKLPTSEHNILDNQIYLPESNQGFQLQDARCWSGSDKPFGEVVVQTKQVSKTRRTMSAPMTQISGPNEMRNQNRSHTNPTIGGAIPFRQQILKHHRRTRIGK